MIRFFLLNISEQNFNLYKNYAIISSIFILILFYLYSSPSLSFIFFSIYLSSSSNSSWSFSPNLPSLSLLFSSLIGFDLFFWYFFTSYLIISYGVYSLSINFVYFSTYYKHWGCSSFLSRVKILFINFILYLYRYLYFALLSYFLLVSLFNRMINKLFSKLLIKSREYIPKVFLGGI